MECNAGALKIYQKSVTRRMTYMLIGCVCQRVTCVLHGTLALLTPEGNT